MNIFETISYRNTNDAANFCRQNGIDVQNEDQCSEALEYLLRNAKDKDAAFASIMSLHPDKDIIVDLYTTRSDFKCGPFNDCGQRLASMKYNVGKGADGSATGMAPTNLHPKIITSTNIILTLCAVAIVIAIVSKSN